MIMCFLFRRTRIKPITLQMVRNQQQKAIQQFEHKLTQLKDKPMRFYQIEEPFRLEEAFG